MSNEQDPMRTYAEAKKRVDAHERQLAEYGKFFGTLGSALSGQPVEMMLSNTQRIEWGAPPEIGLNRSAPSLDYSRWPGKEEVAAELKQYYTAQHELRNAERNLSPADRMVLGISS